MRRLTLVTALFDLAARERNTHRTTIAQYLRRSRWLCELDVDLVVYGDPGAVASIAAARRAAGHGDRTAPRPVRLEELTAHRALPAIEAARRRRPILNGNPLKDTPLYAVLQRAKFELLERALAEDPFRCSHLAWVDAGLSSRPHPGDAVFSEPTDRVTLHVMRGFRAGDLDDRAAYLEYLRGYVAAGYLAGGRDAIAALSASFATEAAAILDDGWAASDEQLLPILALAAGDSFAFSYGGYDGILLNHLRVRGSHGNLMFQLRDARARHHWEHGAAIAAAIRESVEADVLDCPSAELAELLDECFVAAWYGGGEDHAPAASVARLYLDRAATDRSFRDVFLRDEIRVRGNLALLDPPGLGPESV